MDMPLGALPDGLPSGALVALLLLLLLPPPPPVLPVPNALLS